MSLQEVVVELGVDCLVAPAIVLCQNQRMNGHVAHGEEECIALYVIVSRGQNRRDSEALKPSAPLLPLFWPVETKRLGNRHLETGGNLRSDFGARSLSARCSGG